MLYARRKGPGSMPPNLVAASLARRTSDTALCVLGNLLALYNPPTARHMCRDRPNWVDSCRSRFPGPATPVA
jgi:hypothetical protein